MSGQSCTKCGYPEEDHPGFLAVGPCKEYRYPIQHEGGRPPNYRCDKCGKPMEQWAEPCERESAAWTCRE